MVPGYLVSKEWLEEAARSTSLPSTPEDVTEDLVCNAELIHAEKPMWPL